MTIRTLLEAEGYELARLMAGFPEEQNKTPAKVVSYSVRITPQALARLLVPKHLRLSCSTVLSQ